LELPPQGRKETESRAAHVDLDQHEVRFGSWLRGNSETEFANRKFVPTSINLKNESAGDGRGDKTIEKFCALFVRARFHAARVKRRKTLAEHMFSASAPTTDMRWLHRHDRFVPIPEVGGAEVVGLAAMVRKRSFICLAARS
jgi:hypothetical protein